MAKRRTSERHIFFPWERRGGVLRRLVRVDRVRPFVVLLGVFGVLFLIATRERRASGVRRTRATLLDVRETLDSYMADRDGGCPSSLEVLRNYANAEKPLTDAWGKELRLECPGRDHASYDLSSDGPDGIPGGLDRIE